MRAGLVVYGSLDTLSGGYLYDRRLVHHLRAAGDEVAVISLPWRNYGRHLLQNASRSLWRALRSSSFDLLLQDELNHPSLFLLNPRLCRAVDYPVVSIVHHLRSSEQHPPRLLPLYRRIERAYLQSVDGYVFNSETTQTAVVDLAGGGKPAVVAYPAADHIGPAAMPAQQAGDPQVPLRLLFIGNLIPRKGLHQLLAALRQLDPTYWRLSVVGDGHVDSVYARQMQALAQQSAIAQAITWHGRLSNAELRQEFARHDLLVVPSQYEGFGIVYLEAMAYGLPAIATTAGAAGEIISDGVNGFLVAPDDIQRLAARLRLLQADRSTLQTMSRAARARYEQAPTWDQSMSHVREFLLKMVAQ